MKSKEEGQPIMDISKDDPLRQLLRLAGSRPAVPEEVTLRVKSAVHTHWRKSLRARSLKRVFLVSGTVAAGIFFYLISLKLLVLNEIASPLPVGIVENLTGNTLNHPGNGKRPADLLKRGETLTAGALLESDGSGRILLRLIGGVALRMDVNSRLRLQSESSFVLDQGTVYLDSGTQGAHFTLATPMGVVRNYGTQFEVQVGQGAIRIRVREGSVLLDQNGSPRTATAGTELAVNLRGMATVSKVTKYGAPWSWVSQIAPTFHLEGRSLKEFLQWVERENGWNVEFVDPEIQKTAPTIILHGSVAGLRPDQMASTVLPVCGLNYSIDNGILSIRKANLVQR